MVQTLVRPARWLQALAVIAVRQWVQLLAPPLAATATRRRVVVGVFFGCCAVLVSIVFRWGADAARHVLYGPFSHKTVSPIALGMMLIPALLLQLVVIRTTSKTIAAIALVPSLVASVRLVQIGVLDTFRLSWSVAAATVGLALPAYWAMARGSLQRFKTVGITTAFALSIVSLALIMPAAVAHPLGFFVPSTAKVASRLALFVIVHNASLLLLLLASDELILDRPRMPTRGAAITGSLSLASARTLALSLPALSYLATAYFSANWSAGEHLDRAYSSLASLEVEAAIDASLSGELEREHRIDVWSNRVGIIFITGHGTCSPDATVRSMISCSVEGRFTPSGEAPTRFSIGTMRRVGAHGKIEPQRHSPEQTIRESAAKLGIVLPDSAKPDEVVRAMRERVGSKVIKVPIVEAEFSMTTGPWVLDVVLFCLLVVIRSRLERALRDPATAVNEPWILLDASTAAERLVAIVYLASIGLGPALAYSASVLGILQIRDFPRTPLMLMQLAAICVILLLSIDTVAAILKLRIQRRTRPAEQLHPFALLHT